MSYPSSSSYCNSPVTGGGRRGRGGGEAGTDLELESPPPPHPPPPFMDSAHAHRAQLQSLQIPYATTRGGPNPPRPLSFYDNLKLSRANSLMGSGSLTGGSGCGSTSGAVSVGNLTSIGGGGGARYNSNNTSNETPSWANSSYGHTLSPSQVNNMSTTVPQNIGNNTIGGRHAPTRSSLRHSRMIVLNKHGKVPRKYRVPIIHDYKMATSLVIFQMLLGFVVCSLATWLILWAPRLSVSLIPYWSGLPLSLSGVLGVILMCCFRKDHSSLPMSTCACIFKVISLLITGVACAACLAAGISAVLHLIFLYNATCQPINTVNATCVCDSAISPVFDYLGVVTYVYGNSYHYFDLNCLQVMHVLTILLIGSGIANFLANLMLILYMYLHCGCRNGYKYSKINAKSTDQNFLYS